VYLNKTTLCLFKNPPFLLGAKLRKKPNLGQIEQPQSVRESTEPGIPRDRDTMKKVSLQGGQGQGSRGDLFLVGSVGLLVGFVGWMLCGSFVLGMKIFFFGLADLILMAAFF